MLRFFGMVLALLGVTACDLAPRGAGLQSEVLAVATGPNEGSRPDFAIEPVTQQNLTKYLGWPAVNHSHHAWIDRVDQPNTRTIKSGDTITVTVWTNEDNGLLTTPGQRFVTLPATQVSTSGTIFLPYLDTVSVRGLSPERAREVIEGKYQSVSPSAQVQIELAEGRQNTVSLVGGVASPGSFTLPDNDYTLMEVISEAGGVSADLNNPQIKLHRGERIFGTSVDRLLNTPRLNTTLVGGDRIFVENDDRSFLSLGAAGTEAVHPFTKDRISALEALAIIGGLRDDRADAQGILILRRYHTNQITQDQTGPNHPRTVFTLDLTSADGLFSADQFAIQSGDLVYVSESPITAARSILGVLGATLGISGQLGG